MKCLVSFSLWGDNPIYTQGAVKQLNLFNEWSKNGPHSWDCMFFVGDSVPKEISNELKALGAFVVYVLGTPEDQTSTFWRFRAFLTAFGFYDAIFSRDVDSRLSEREKLAISQFLSSKKGFHIIRDHPFHGVPILAGLFGAKSSISGIMNSMTVQPEPDFYKTVNRWIGGKGCTSFKDNNFYQVDQWWLRIKLYPQLRNEILAHDCFFGFERRRNRMFLPDREPGDFIGKGFDENDFPRHPEHDILVNQWPSRCR